MWPASTRSSPQEVPILQTPIRAPNANAHAERFIRSLRSECLDHLLIVNEPHLERILRSYARHYNRHRPHQGLAQETPITVDGLGASAIGGSRLNALPPGQGLRRRDRLGGLIHEYEVADEAPDRISDGTGCAQGRRRVTPSGRSWTGPRPEPATAAPSLFKCRIDFLNPSPSDRVFGHYGHHPVALGQSALVACPNHGLSNR